VAVVIDASALAYALLSTSPNATALRDRLVSEECHAPHLIDAEVGNVLRRRVLRGEIAAVDAEELLAVAPALVDYRYEMTGGLAQAAWSRRQNLTFYDALYVALAATLSIPLLTADDHLRRAPDLGCAVEEA
jgi:predicted nucleic acid-binding protein